MALPLGILARLLQAITPTVNMSATGGTITDVGGYRYHTFTTSGTFTVSANPTTVDYLIVAGGAGGGGGKFDQSMGGGGGAGGYLSSTFATSATSYTITIGAGGAGGDGTSTSTASAGSDGSNSSAFSQTATGGGGGGTYFTAPKSGGSGGGGGNYSPPFSGASGTSGQGNAGGNAVVYSGSSATSSGGGGGAGSAGVNASSGSGGNGGSGSTWLNGSTYAGGGGGAGTSSGGTGGSSIGGNGAIGTAGGSNAVANTGSGGGGGAGGNNGADFSNGGNGSSGVVIIRYPYVAPAAFELIETVVLSSNASSVTFSNLGNYSSEYKHLQIRGVVRSSAATGGTDLQIRLNSDSGTNYVMHGLYGNGSSALSFSSLSRTILYGAEIETANSAANAFSPLVIDFADAYNTNKFTTMRSFNAKPTGPLVALFSSLWRNTASITTISLFCGAGDLASGSRISLYGIRG